MNAIHGNELLIHGTSLMNQLSEIFVVHSLCDLLNPDWLANPDDVTRTTEV